MLILEEVPQQKKIFKTKKKKFDPTAQLLPSVIQGISINIQKQTPQNQSPIAEKKSVQHDTLLMLSDDYDYDTQQKTEDPE